MKLRGINFGPIWGGSGVQGFFGEGYWYHSWLEWLGLDFSGMTFVAKTTTLRAHTGNMPMREDRITPREYLPRCIAVKPFKGIALNAIGLSGPGAKVLLAKNRWQFHRHPFFLSFMSVSATMNERFDELEGFIKLLATQRTKFESPFGLQLNFSCPNVGVSSKTDELISEIEIALDIAAILNIPLVPKLNILAPPSIVRRLEAHPACDAVCVSNTLPFGALPERLDWEKLWPFGSPLLKRKLNTPIAGGLSGKNLFPLVRRWVQRARACSAHFPINAGGGILTPDNAISLLQDGADSVFIASMAFLRPWNVKKTIRAVQAYAAGERD